MQATQDLIDTQEDRDAQRDRKIQVLKDAFENDGPHPRFHKEQKMLLQYNWNPLYDAIIDLIE